jgi:hypothetical protein
MKAHLLAAAALLVAGPALCSVVINEIHYNPASAQGDDTLYEFLELYNSSATPADLSGWQFDQGISHLFAPGSEIAGHGYLVLAVDAAACEAYYGISDVVEWDGGALSNSGEALRLVDAGLVIVDELSFDDGGCWPGAPDGDGPSLELINPALDNALCENWAASTGFGTPGAQNSAYTSLTGPPLITSVLRDPVAPSFDELVTVTATVIDEGAVTLVQLEVLVDGLPVGIDPMLPLGGDLFEGSIAAQPAGSLVEYRVLALDDDSDSAVSDWFSYSVAAGTVDIVINEIHYNGPEAGTDVTEFVELYNNGGATVDLEGWSFTGFTFTFPAGVLLAPGEYLVVAVDAAAFFAFYGFLPDFEWESGALSNGGELLLLSDAWGNVMDSVEYDDGGAWPNEPDGFGPSLELIDPSLDNALASSWQASHVDGGTPRAANSQPIAVEALEQPAVFSLGAAWPNPFNPVTNLRFQLPETAPASLRVYDLMGREVAVLASGILAGGEHHLSFDATGLASGVYIARLQSGTYSAATRLLLVK